MRRVLGPALVLTVLVPALAVSAATTQDTVADRFDSVSYSGNNGTKNWSGPWAEQGESDGPGTGQISVGGGDCADTKCLNLAGGLLEEIAIARPADLSDFVDATLGFYVHIEPGLLSTGVLYAEVRGNGSGWQVVADYALLADAGTHHESVDIGDYLGSDFRVRFRLTGLLGGDSVFVDDVEVTGNVPSSTTTSTTSTTTTTSSTTSTTTSTTVGSGGASSSSSTTTTTAGPAEREQTGDSGLESSEADDAEDDPVPTNTVAGPSSGLRAPLIGVLTDHRPRPVEDPDPGRVEVLAAELDADFSLAVEVFEKARIWISILALLIAAAVVGGMDRRRSRDNQV